LTTLKIAVLAPMPSAIGQDCGDRERRLLAQSSDREAEIFGDHVGFSGLDCEWRGRVGDRRRATGEATAGRGTLPFRQAPA
jgi:hypothetical protein